MSSQQENTENDEHTKGFFSGLKGTLISLAIVVAISAIAIIAFYPASDLDNSEQTSSTSTIPAVENDFSTNEDIVDGKDVQTGLIAGEGLELVKGHCTACHSSALILQNRFSREGWLKKIVWMQETQGLWDLGEQEAPILDYLEAYYSPEPPKGRRIPLSDIEWYQLN